ncbi:MAG TPA: 8-amino-7-oxononanoate synthase [Flavobacteriales bacterium]|jgi:glycine C-acetyltransferase|nr:8-amino-7-oxononanoate synthase [Flavobacteriales bacterium]
MVDIFDKIKQNRGPLGQYSKVGHGYFFFPKLEGDISNKMYFRGREVLVWSLNNYLGLANHPDVREVDARASQEFGLGHPMGSRMMSGNTNLHEELEEKLARFAGKEAAILLNYGYQGMASAVDALVDRKDVVVYDSESHACIMDGMRMHQGKRFVFPHNDIEQLELMLKRATKLSEETEGGILVLTEGVFGMAGDQGHLKEIVALKEKYNFRLFVDDAHGVGTMGEQGRGTGYEQGCQDGIDVYFGTFAKSFALIGGFIAADEDIIEFLNYNARSQIFAKSLPNPIVAGAIKRLDMIQNEPEHRANLWKIVNALQKGLRAEGFNLGNTNSPVTPVFMEGTAAMAANLVVDLRENFGIFCSIVVYPVVPKDTIMLRLIPTAMHTLEDVEYTIETFKKIKTKLQNKEYISDRIVI